jgi:hypothetical protein
LRLTAFQASGNVYLLISLRLKQFSALLYPDLNDQELSLIRAEAIPDSTPNVQRMGNPKS